MLGLSQLDSQIAQSMITTGEVLPGFDVIASLGPVEGIVEKTYTKSSVAAMGVGIGVVDAGGLSNMVFDAKQLLAREAFGMGANAVVGFRFTLSARELEKSLIAYGIAVKCQKRHQQGSN